MIGEKCCGGYSTSKCLIFGRNAIDESFIEILESLKHHENIYIVSGLGGGIGGAAPHLANKLIKIGKKVGLILSILDAPWESERVGFMVDDSLLDANKIKSDLSSFLVIKKQWNEIDMSVTLGDMFTKFHMEIADQVSAVKSHKKLN